jgi:hypothetical protein
VANKDKTQLITTWVVSPDQVSEMDRLAESHGSFKSKSHDREGSSALLTYDLSKGHELENPLDPSSNRTGNTRHVLSEVYDSPAGIENHWRVSQESWSDFGAMVEMPEAATPRHCILGPSSNPSGRRTRQRTPTALERAPALIVHRGVPHHPVSGGDRLGLTGTLMWPSGAVSGRSTLPSVCSGDRTSVSEDLWL